MTAQRRWQVALEFATLLLLTGVTPLRAQTGVVQEGDSWRFFRARTAPADDWKDVTFDPDAAGWESGPTGIGYGDGDDATVLDDMQDSYVTVYLRRDFVVPEELDGSVWTLDVRFDDGFVAYLDGVEIARRRVTGDPPAFDELAYDQHEIESAPGSFDERFIVPDGTYLLQPGPHLLAAEVHNVSPGSSDLSFSARLMGGPFLVDAIQPTIVRTGEGGEVSIFGLGFRADELPTVTFGGLASPQVTVISEAELRAVVPEELPAGPADVVVENSRGRVVLPGALLVADASFTGLVFSGQNNSPSGATARGLAGELEEGTVELWFARDEEGGFFTPWRSLFSLQDESGEDAIDVEIQDASVRARSFVEGAEAVTLQGDADLQSDWHHLAYVFGPGGRRLVVDGRVVAADAAPLNLSGVQALRLGANFGGGYGFFFGPLQGRIASARLWSVERDPADLARDAFNPLEGGAEELLASWSLGEAGGQTAADSSPAGRDLILGDTVDAEASDPAWTALEDFPRIAVLAVEPGSGSREGGEPVDIFGTGFGGTAITVLFGGVESETVEVIDSWQIRALTPPATAFGPVDVTVITGAGQAVAPSAFTYDPPELEDLVVEGDEWWYAVGLVAPPVDWNEPGFDAADAGWSSGPSGLGYGDGDDATVVDLQGAATLYVRREFEFDADPEAAELLLLRVRFDDGYVAYLNGEEVSRQNVLGDPPAFDELASNHEIESGPGEFDLTVDLSAAGVRLARGRNVLAIEAHNTSPGSSDLSISAELAVATRDRPAGPLFVRADLDGDAKISVTDAVRVILVLFATFPLECAEAADADDSGTLGVMDSLYIVEYLFRGGPPPAPPFPEPGPDEDQDFLGCPRSPLRIGGI